MITSKAAVDIVAGRPDRAALTRLPLYVVGDATAAAARAAGFPHVVSAAGDVEALAETIRRDGLAPGATVLHLAGRDRAGDLAGLLAPDGITVAIAVLYRAEPSETLPEAVAAALRAGAIDAILVYSERSAAALAASIGRAGLSDAVRDIAVVAISARAAAPFAGLDRSSSRRPRTRRPFSPRWRGWNAASEAALPKVGEGTTSHARSRGGLERSGSI